MDLLKSVKTVELVEELKKREASERNMPNRTPIKRSA